MRGRSHHLDFTEQTCTAVRVDKISEFDLHAVCSDPSFRGNLYSISFVERVATIPV